MLTPGQSRLRQHVHELLPQYRRTKSDDWAQIMPGRSKSEEQEELFLDLAKRLENDPVITTDEVTGSTLLQITDIQTTKPIYAINPSHIVEMGFINTFVYTPAPQPSSPSVIPRDLQNINKAYFGGEKWRTTMWALFEIACSPAIASVDSALLFTSDQCMANGSDGTHRLLAAFLWGAEFLRGSSPIIVHF